MSVYYRFFGAFYTAMLLLTACMLTACTPAQEKASTKLNLVATTTLVGDIVKNVGGESVDLFVLIPAGVDEHAYEPTPQDIVKVSNADVLFINGAGLEPFIERITQNSGVNVPTISVSDGIELMEGHEDEHEGESEAEHAAEGEAHQGDPHVWTDPNNVLVWLDNIEKALAEADPDHAGEYQKNAAAYRVQLNELDTWIQEQVAQVPVERRKLVTDHLVFTYFSNRYDFEQIGAVVPGYSTLSASSAQELAALEESIRTYQVPAIFVGNTVNQTLSQRVAQDTNTQLVQILTGSLTTADGPAPTYLDYMRYNVDAITSALK